MCCKNQNFILLFLIFSAFFTSSALAQVDVVLLYPSSFHFTPDDLWNVQISNHTNSAKKVYLRGTVKTNSQQVLVKATSQAFEINTGTSFINPLQVSASNIEVFNNELQEKLRDYKQFPSGAYISCVVLVDALTNIELSSNCVENYVEVISPPRLLAPYDKENITIPYPTFSWTPPAPFRQGQQVNYKVKVVELYENQSAIDGINNNPAFYFENNYQANYLTYSVLAPLLNNKKKYAWQVEASIGKFSVGKSEIWIFGFKPGSADSIPKILDDQNYFYLTKNPDNGYYLAKGFIKFKFQDEYNTGFNNIKIYDISHKEITPKELVLLKPYKDDRYIIDLTQASGFKNNNYYYLELLYAPTKEPYMVRFKYLEPSTKN